MSATKLVPLDFSTSYEDLLDDAVDKIAFLTRDEADLSPRGVTAAVIAAFDADRAAFALIPSNETGVLASGVGFAARDKKAAQLLKAIMVVMGIVNTTFAKTSSEYKGFKAKGIGKFNASQLYNISNNIVVKATLNTAALTPKGLTPAMLTSITTLATALLPLISATPVLVSNAEAVTVTRRTTANALFATMKALCSIGYAFYMAQGNKLKAADYVVYDSARTIIDRTGTVKQGSFVNRKTDDIVAGTRFRLKVSTGTTLQFYFGMTKTSLPDTLAKTVVYNPNIFATYSAAQLGYDLAGGIKYFIIRNPNSDDADFLAKIG